MFSIFAKGIARVIIKPVPELNLNIMGKMGWNQTTTAHKCWNYIPNSIAFMVFPELILGTLSPDYNMDICKVDKI